ncbi:MAG: metal-dependent transcriptional regulator [Erysipelotrichaceae bacterium]|nr:metal-dependent transcriptional regulator [Erysipelotrichaceae bacterium]
MKLGESLEDYLECLLILGEKGKIRSVDVAKMMNVTKPSVNNAMKILKEKGYVLQESYKDIQLTQQGHKLASSIFKRHQILTAFLRDILHVEETTAEEDACKMEHILSKETFHQLSLFYEQYMQKQEN